MNIKKCFEVDVDCLKKYDMVKSIDRLNEVFKSKENKEGVGLYNFVDELDAIEAIYYIIKYSKGNKRPSKRDIKELGMDLTMKRIADEDNQYTDFYNEYNGEITDIHLIFLGQRIYGRFSDYLLNNCGFDASIIIYINLFLAHISSLFFTFDDIKRFSLGFNESVQVESMLVQYVKKNSIGITDLKLQSIKSFKKDFLKNNFIKIDSQRYLGFYHLIRTSYLTNFHYMLYKDEEYKKYRGDIFENITEELFKHHLTNARIYKNLKYNRGEVDVLVEYDNIILIIECKSGLLYTDYRLGEQNEKVNKNISAIYEKAKNQLNNIKVAIETKCTFRDGKHKVIFDSSKEIIKLQVCYEMPIGIANKDKYDQMISITLPDLMIIVDQIEYPTFSNIQVDNIISYLHCRQELLGINTDDEITIMIFILYNHNMKKIINNDLISKLRLDSKDSISRINEFYSFLMRVYIFKDSREYELVEFNYHGFLREFILN